LLTVVVALGEPSVPVTCCAILRPGTAAVNSAAAQEMEVRVFIRIFCSPIALL
jgi:hypothetical protein